MKAVGVAAIATLFQIAIGFAGELVDLDKAKSDPAYRERVYYHTAIKSYLASPLKGKPELEEILTFLLKDGFTIRDLHNAYVELHLPRSNPANRPGFRRELFERGFNEDQIEMRVAEVSAQAAKRHRQIVQQSTGLDDGLLEDFMRLAPESPTSLRPSSTFMPSVEAEDGEPLLTDSDWMSDEHREAAAAYRGERRRLAPSPPAKAAPPLANPYKMEKRLIPRALPRRSSSTNTFGAAAPGSTETPSGYDGDGAQRGTEPNCGGRACCQIRLVLTGALG